MFIWHIWPFFIFFWTPSLTQNSPDTHNHLNHGHPSNNDGAAEAKGWHQVDVRSGSPEETCHGAAEQQGGWAGQDTEAAAYADYDAAYADAADAAAYNDDSNDAHPTRKQRHCKPETSSWWSRSNWRKALKKKVQSSMKSERRKSPQTDETVQLHRLSNDFG